MTLRVRMIVGLAFSKGPRTRADATADGSPVVRAIGGQTPHNYSFHAFRDGICELRYTCCLLNYRRQRKAVVRTRIRNRNSAKARVTSVSAVLAESRSLRATG